MPRTQATICGAPKTSTMPITTPTSHHQLILPNQPSTPETITATTATGVRMVSRLDWIAWLPVANGPPAPVLAGSAAASSARAVLSALRARRCGSVARA
jgi:hypothetical protein